MKRLSWVCLVLVSGCAPLHGRVARTPQDIRAGMPTSYDKNPETDPGMTPARWRAVGAAAAGLAAAGAALQHSSGGGYDGAVQTGGCTSDYDCGGYGMACVKGYAQMYGQCARTVNQYGMPTYSPPQNNFGTNMSRGCMVSPCPIGFMCNYSTGICYR